MSATVTKSEEIVGTTLVQTVNTDYMGTIQIFMDNCTPGKALAEAIANCGYKIGDVPIAPANAGQFAGLDLEVVAIEAFAQSDTKVQVSVKFGMSQVPLTTDTKNDSGKIKWVYETHQATRQIQSALDTDKKPIVVKYWPKISAVGDPTAYMAYDDWKRPNAQRRYVRMMTATKYMPWTTAVCRARIHKSFDAAQPSMKATLLAQLIGGTYNDFAANPLFAAGGAPGIRARQWMCQGVTCTTPNQGLIHNVEVTLVHNPYGWDPYVIYVDPLWNGIPNEVADALLLPANADLITVDHEYLTEPTDKPYGVKRPYIANKYNYSQLGIDLFKITGSY